MTTSRHERLEVWRFQVRAALVVARKDVRIYYFKPPVVTFGLVFPLFFFLAFAVGRPVPLASLVPSVLAMALFFSASAVGPLITPWERQARTWERLVTSPASLEAILAGDVLAASVFGAGITLLPLVLGLAVTPARITAPLELVAGLFLGSLAFAALGVLIAARGTDTPSEVMMLSNLVRLPLIFVSGVLVPLDQVPAWGRWVAPLSPLTYGADLLRGGLGAPHFFPSWLDAFALVAFAVGFLTVARWLHHRRDRAV
ncbi:MAG: ABC transporter permease [Candidatus Rokubacteria bacterium]|nr:ABC transporter permease [Candidatus Rokubacteria bacterium]